MLLEREGVVVDSCSGFKKEGMLIDHKLNNYDGSYKGPTPLIHCWGDGGNRYETSDIKRHWEKCLFTC